MKEFNELTGPWAGQSVQNALRISESIRLTIRTGQVWGSGVDKDGDFELTGNYNARTQQVTLTRRYTRTTEPSQEGVGIAYDYSGIWDGSMVHGHWHFRINPSEGGPFEMWPNRDEDREELKISLENTALVPR